MDNTSEEEVVSKRAPRKRARATRETVSKRDVLRDRPTPVVEKKTKPVAEPRVENAIKSIIRKSPTPLTAERKLRNTKRKKLLIVCAILLLGIGGSAAIGYQDKGVIDVNVAIAERNAKNQSSGDVDQVVIPVQNTNKAPNGGLRGLGVGAAPPEPKPAEEVATTTASSSDATASSSDEVLTADTEDEASAEEL